MAAEVRATRLANKIIEELPAGRVVPTTGSKQTLLREGARRWPLASAAEL